jgi:hypothetical protein
VTASSNVKHALLSLIVLSVVSCSTKVDKSYSTDCEVDDDCTLMCSCPCKTGPSSLLFKAHPYFLMS